MGDRVAPGGESWFAAAVRYLKRFEPAVVQGIVVSIVAVLAIWGLDVSGVAGDIVETWNLLYGILPALTGLLIRQSVTPAAAVAAKVTPSGEVVSGPADEKHVSGTVVEVKYPDEDVYIIE